MHAYNRINGVYACEHEYLLTRILRQEWGFKGAVVSDWTGTHSTVPSVKAGLDLEMPGPAMWFGKLLEHAVRTWQVDESVIDAAARRVLRLVFQSGKMDNPPATPAGSVNTPRTRPWRARWPNSPSFCSRTTRRCCRWIKRSLNRSP